MVASDHIKPDWKKATQTGKLEAVQASSDYSSENCSVARTLAVIGERWTLLILREAFYGVCRFRDFQSRLGVASNLLTARLDTLVDAGIMERVPYQDPGDRQRHEYHLTRSGVDLRPILVALLQWGDRYLADADGPSVILRHRTGAGEPDCEQPVHVEIACDGGHAPLDGRAVWRTPGPGARLRDPGRPAPGAEGVLAPGPDGPGEL